MEGDGKNPLKAYLDTPTLPKADPSPGLRFLFEEADQLSLVNE